MYYTRVSAIYALGQIGDTRALEPLCRVVSDEREDKHVRAVTIRALSNIGDPRAIPVVERAVDANIFSEVVEGYLEELRRKAGAK